MIPKKKEDYTFPEGAGRPFEMNPRYPIEKNDAERQRPIVIHLGELNGQTTAKGMPKNFIRKAGRCLPSFDRYWTTDEIAEYGDEDFDIQ
jgi:hypothetical protein